MSILVNIMAGDVLENSIGELSYVTLKDTDNSASNEPLQNTSKRKP